MRAYISKRSARLGQTSIFHVRTTRYHPAGHELPRELQTNTVLFTRVMTHVSSAVKTRAKFQNTDSQKIVPLLSAAEELTLARPAGGETEPEHSERKPRVKFAEGPLVDCWSLGSLRAAPRDWLRGILGACFLH